MAFNPTNNPLLPPNTALVSTGVTFSLQSTGFAQRGIAKDANGNILFEGPETAASVYTIFDVLYTELYPFSSNQPSVEINILDYVTEDNPVAPIELEEVTITAKASTPKENAESRKKQLEESTDNILSNTEQPKGIAKFTPIILEKGSHIVLTMAPTLAEMAAQYLPENVDKNINQDDVKQAIIKLNNIIDDLNGISEFLNKITEVSTAISTAVSVTQTVANVLNRSIPIVSGVAKAIPLIPGAIVSSLDDLNWIKGNLLFSSDGTPKLPKLLSGVNAITGATAIVSLSILKVTTIIEALIARLQTLLNQPVEIGPDDSLSDTYDIKPLSPETKKFAELGNSDYETNDPLTYKGFILSIETVPFTPTVNRYQAVGSNTFGIPLIKGELSFSSNAQVLINELKFRIDRDNLKAY